MQLEMDFGNTKVCGTCKETKDRREFNKNKNTKDGLQWECKSCVQRRYRARRDYYAANPQPTPATKECAACKETKDRREFNNARHKKDGLSPSCKSCLNQRQIALAAKYTRRHTLVSPPDRNGTKRCHICGETKQKTEFTVDRCRQDGRCSSCKSCSVARITQWRKDNPGKANALVARRNARKLKATPSWEDKSKTLWYYDESQRISTETGVVHHVDHRVPLNHWSVRGLHWHGNFDVLPGAENSSKGNRFWPDDWHDYYHEFYDEFLALKEYALSLRKRTNRVPAAKAPTGTATTKPKVSASASPATRASATTQIQETQQI